MPVAYYFPCFVTDDEDMAGRGGLTAPRRGLGHGVMPQEKTNFVEKTYEN
jgi:hypothetical protein